MELQKSRERKRKKSSHIRWMINRDLPAVMAVERESFECAWTQEDFLNTLRQRNCIGMVMDEGDYVVGFMIYELHKDRIEILNFAVHPQYRNNGYGSAMLEKLKSKLGQHRKMLALNIIETNLPAHLFFSRHGFVATGIVKQPYEFGYLADAYRFQFRADWEG